jgi:hypothetical protein
MNKIFYVGADGFVRDGLTNEKYRAVTGAPPVTASKDLKSLVSNGLMLPSSTGNMICAILLISHKSVSCLNLKR